jgi:glycosyltransferase involved in cell wall biosynthesis
LRVLIANDTYPPQLNGAAIATQRLALGLANRGHQVAVVAPNMSFKDETDEETVAGNGAEISVFRVRSLSVKPLHPQFRVTYWFGVHSKLSQIVRDFQPDIIHIQNHFILGQGCLKIARNNGIPIIGTNHFLPNNLFEFIPSPLRPAISGIMWGHFLKTYNRLDCVVAPSHACLQILREVGLTATAQVVSNGIDLSKYKKVDPPEDIFLQYGVLRDCPTFLAVGRLEKDKNVELILRATALVAEEAQIQTIFVGTGRDEAEFKSLAHKLGLGDSVVFTGFVPDDDLPYLYSISDIYIGAGAAELQGIAVMEAMATGLPVLAANAVALPELVNEGENGYLFALDPGDLADKMRKMLSQPESWQRMGEKSLACIQVHDTPNALSQLEDLYREVISSTSNVSVV